MNCIFICVFYQKRYVDMCSLLLESILICGQLDDNTEILVYTSTNFMNIIKQCHFFDSEKIKFEINDKKTVESYDESLFTFINRILHMHENTYINIKESCCARLDFFQLSNIHNYEKILYLDTDIIVKDNINNLFDICKEDVLYVVEEGTIDHLSLAWGQLLFKDEVNDYEDKSAFSSGLLLFNNCEKIKYLFEKIKEDIVNRPFIFDCYDQPYIIYNAFKYNLYNNKLLNNLIATNDMNIFSDAIIHHFHGIPGYHTDKLQNMFNFLNNIKRYKAAIK